MEAATLRKIKDGSEFIRLFPKAELENTTVIKNADLEDTMTNIPKVVKRYGYQSRMIADYLNRNNVYESCKNIWHWVYNHIAYWKDKTGYEQLRTPARTFHDRKMGVDCDCYSIFISCILQHLEIPHILRITKYKENHFQHIYPVVIYGGKEIIMDCVVDAFDFEVPYSEKKDYTMELQVLSGLDDQYSDPLGELGKVIKKKFAPGAKPTAAKKALPAKKAAKKEAKAVKKAAAKAAPKPKGKLLNKFNKINPTTVMLRNGVLASMKLNIGQVAGRLRWSYLTSEQAAQKNIDPAKFTQLVNVRKRLEDLFFKAGGKPENLKEAILKGKGNQDNAVNGLGYVDNEIGYLNEYYSLPELLGHELYYSENVQGMEGFQGFGSLGEPVTLATIAAAAGVIAGIAGALKQVGDIFSGKGKESEDFAPEKIAQAEQENPAPAPALPAVLPAPVNNMAVLAPRPQNDEVTYTPPPPAYIPPAAYTPPAKTDEQSYEAEKADEFSFSDESKEDDKSAKKDDDPKKEKGFWDKNKEWIIPASIGGIGLIAIIFAATHKPPRNNNPPPPQNKQLSGVPRTKKNHQRKPKKRKKQLTAKALL